MNRVRSLLSVSDRFFGIRDFPYLLGIRDFKAKSGKIRDWTYAWELECMPKIILGATGLHEILGRDYRIEEPYIVEHVS